MVYHIGDLSLFRWPAFESPYGSDYDLLKGIERRLRERPLAEKAAWYRNTLKVE
jgi:hypothetical protein